MSINHILITKELDAQFKTIDTNTLSTNTLNADNVSTDTLFAGVPRVDLTPYGETKNLFFQIQTWADVAGISVSGQSVNQYKVGNYLVYNGFIKGTNNASSTVAPLVFKLFLDRPIDGSLADAGASSGTATLTCLSATNEPTGKQFIARDDAGLVDITTTGQSVVHDLFPIGGPPTFYGFIINFSGSIKLN